MSDVLQSQGDYWQRTLAGAPTLLELPTDRPRPAEQDCRGAFVDVELDEQLTAQLRILSRRSWCHAFHDVVAGWGVLLSRLSGPTIS